MNTSTPDITPEEELLRAVPTVSLLAAFYEATISGTTKGKKAAALIDKELTRRMGDPRPDEPPPEIKVLSSGAGPGKYDDACTAARQATRASTAILMVLRGDQGDGFAVQTLVPDIIPRIPELLRGVASQIEETLGAQEN